MKRLDVLGRVKVAWAALVELRAGGGCTRTHLRWQGRVCAVTCYVRLNVGCAYAGLDDSP